MNLRPWRWPLLLGALLALSWSTASCSCSPCSEAETQCGSSCVDLLTDEASCGRCGLACAATEHCAQGRCVPGCQVGWQLCGGACVDVAVDAQNCGGCGEACADTQYCANSLCHSRAGSCPHVFLQDGEGWRYQTDLSGSLLAAGLTFFKPEYYGTNLYELGTWQAAADGVFRMRLRELNFEASYFDEAQLLVADLPEGYGLLNEWSSTPQIDQAPSLRFHTVRDPRPPLTAVSESGADVVPQLREADGVPLPIERGQLSRVVVDFGPIEHPERARARGDHRLAVARLLVQHRLQRRLGEGRARELVVGHQANQPRDARRIPRQAHGADQQTHVFALAGHLLQQLVRRRGLHRKKRKRKCLQAERTRLQRHIPERCQGSSAIAEQNGRLCRAKAALGVFVLEGGDEERQQVDSPQLAGTPHCAGAQCRLGGGDQTHQRRTGIHPMQGAGGNPDALPEWVRTGQQAAHDPFQARRRNPTQGRDETCKRLGQRGRDRQHLVETIDLALVEGANGGTEHLTRARRLERRIAELRTAFARHRQAVEMSGNPVIQPPQVVQLYMRRRDQHGAYVAKVRSFIGVLANDGQNGLGKIAVHRSNYHSPIRGLFSCCVTRISAC